MATTTLGIDDASQWIVLGWRAFKKSIFTWLLLSVFFIVGLFLLNQTPFAGRMVAALISPALFAVLLLCAHDLNAERRFSTQRLIETFKDPGCVLSLLTLGLLPFAIVLLQTLLTLIDFPSVIISLLGLTLWAFAASALFYGLPLVLFEKRAPLEAARHSMRVCLREPVAISTFIAFAFVLLIIAAIPLGLGILVYLPVIAGATYASYRQVI